MTYEEFEERVALLNGLTADLKREFDKYRDDIKKLESEYIREHSLLQVGDKVSVTYKKWVSNWGMTEVTEFAYVRSVKVAWRKDEPFYYTFFKAKKDGSKSVLGLNEYPSKIEVKAEI